jgi:hypothetical protein
MKFVISFEGSMMNSKGFGRKRLWRNRGSIPEFSEGSEENDEKPLSRQLVSQSRFEPKTFRVYVYRLTVTLTF